MVPALKKRFVREIKGKELRRSLNSHMRKINKEHASKELRPFWVRAHFGQSNFPFFQQKQKKEILLILIIFAYFKVQKKKRKKENGYDNRSFFSFF